MFVTILIIASLVSASSLIMTYWWISASSLSIKFQLIWKNFFGFTTTTKREKVMLSLRIMYAHFRQIVFVSVFSRSCEFVMLDELATIVVSWLNRQLISLRQRSHLNSKQIFNLLSEVNDCSHVKDRILSTHDILKVVSWDFLNLWIIDSKRKQTRRTSNITNN